MNRGADHPAEQPWYRHLWVWLLMLPPAAAVVGGVLTAWLAGGPPALVVDDYSEIALTSEQRQARDQRARALGLRAELRLPAASVVPGRLSLVLEGAGPAFRAPEQLRLRLIHPTREELDRSLTLTGAGDGTYTAMLVRPTVRYYVELADEAGEWRLVGELQPAAPVLQLGAAAAARVRHE